MSTLQATAAGFMQPVRAGLPASIRRAWSGGEFWRAEPPPDHGLRGNLQIVLKIQEMRDSLGRLIKFAYFREMGIED
jgi:hypothetical protein